MPLTLRITNPPAPQPGFDPVFVLHERGGSIGRRDANDWTLPDPERFISGQHAAVRFESGTYFLDDVSVNGVFLNDTPQPIGRGNAVRLNDGDRLFIGDYEISVSIAEPVANADPFGTDPFASDPFAAPPDSAPAAPYNRPPDPATSAPQGGGWPPPHDPYNSVPPAAPEPGPVPGQDGPSLDPLDLIGAPDPAVSGPGGGGWGETPSQPYARPMADHSAATSDSFTPPAPSSNQIPEGFDPLETSFSMPEQRTAPSAQPPSQPTPEYSPPSAYPPQSPAPATPAAAPPQQPVAPSGPPAAAGNADALRTLLDGAGLDPARVPVSSGPALMHIAGQIFREVVRGMMEVLQARANLKSEFRMQLTTIRPQENNPLKFSVGVDEALQELLFNETRGYLPPVQAVEEGFNDIRAHQMAMMAGMRAAFQAVLTQFDPDKLSARFDRDSKRGSLLSMGGGKARYWDSYTELYEEMTRDPDQCFRSLFGDEFSRAYEEQMAKLSRGH